MEEKEREEAEETEEEKAQLDETVEVKEEEETKEEEMAEAEEVIEEARVEEKPTPTEAEAEAEEVKPPLREEKVEEEIVEERIYTIPLGKAWIKPPNKRAPKAIRIIRDFIKKHMKLERPSEGEEEEPKRLIISNEVNERIWSRGIEKPPRKIRVRAAKDKDGNVTVYLAEGD
ncbi:MAG: 50S ribosomal protein L31e [Candidatus Bathyarchaeia archaeon]